MEHLPAVGPLDSLTAIEWFFTGLLVVVSVGIALMVAVVLLKLFRGQS